MTSWRLGLRAPLVAHKYAVPAWQDTSPEYLSVKLESIQKRALKIVL